MNDISNKSSKANNEMPKIIFWEKIITEQKMSGKKMNEFCQERQLSLEAFKYYKYRALRDKKKISGDSGSFIPLQVISEEAATKPKAEKIEIIFRNGHRLAIPLDDLQAALFIIEKIAGLRC
jgi:hypothetical protein